MQQIPADELDKIYAFAITLAKQAGQLLLDGIEQRRRDIEEDNEDGPLEKVNAVDLVTQTDNGLWPVPSTLDAELLIRSGQ